MNRPATKSAAWASDLRAINQAFEARERQLTNHADSLQQALDAQQALLEDKTQHSARLIEVARDTAASVEAKLAEAERAGDSLRRTVATLEAELRKRQDQAALVASELEKRTTLLKAEYDEQLHDRERLVAAERQAAAEAVQVAVTRALEQQQATVVQSARVVEGVRGELATSTARLTQAGQEREALERAVAALETDLLRRQEEFLELNERLEEATKAVARAHAERLSACQLLEAESASALREQELRLLSDFEQRQALNQAEFAEQARLRERVAAEERQSAAAAVQLAVADALEQQQASAHKSVRDVQALRDQLASLEGKLAVSQEKNHALVASLEDATNAAARLQTEEVAARQALEAHCARAMREQEARLEAAGQTVIAQALEQQRTALRAAHEQELALQREEERMRVEETQDRLIDEHRAVLALSLEAALAAQQEEHDLRLQERLNELQVGLMAAFEAASRQRESTDLARLQQQTEEQLTQQAKEFAIRLTAALRQAREMEIERLQHQEVAARGQREQALQAHHSLLSEMRSLHEQSAAREREFAARFQQSQDRTNECLAVEKSVWRERESQLLKMVADSQRTADSDRLSMAESFGSQIAALEGLYRDKQDAARDAAEVVRRECLNKLAQADMQIEDLRQEIQSCETALADARRSIWARIFSPKHRRDRAHDPMARRESASVRAASVTEPVVVIARLQSKADAAPDHKAPTETTVMNSPAPAPDSLSELLNLFDADFVVHAYRMILGRTPDPSGFHNFLGQVRAGKSKESVVVALATSAEARSIGVSLDGVAELLRRYKPSRRSLIARVVQRARSSASARLDQQFRGMENWLGVLRAEQARVQMLLVQDRNLADQASAVQADRYERLTTVLTQLGDRLAAQQADIARLADSSANVQELQRHRMALEENAKVLAARTDAALESMRMFAAEQQTRLELAAVEVKKRADHLESILARPASESAPLQVNLAAMRAKPNTTSPEAEIRVIMESVIRAAQLAREQVG